MGNPKISSNGKKKIKNSDKKTVSDVKNEKKTTKKINSVPKNDKKKAEKKFVPKKIPRYLPGSVHQAVLRNDLKEYNKHLYNIFSATPKVDAKPPIFQIDTYMNVQGLEGQVYLIREREAKNKKILEKINYINRTHGILDTFNKKAYENHSKWAMKERQFKMINIDNQKMYNRILNAKPVYPKAGHDKHWKRMIGKMEHFAKFPLVLINTKTKDDLLRECPSISIDYPDVIPERPRCWMEFKIDNGIKLGKMAFELYYDQMPHSSEAFMALCRGENKSLLNNFSLFKIVEGKYCVMGDVAMSNLQGNGKRVDNYYLQHTRPGVLSVSPDHNNIKDLQYCITFDEIEEMNSKFIVFGKVTKGAAVLYKLSDFGSWHGKPVTKIIISDCGICVKKKKRHLRK